MDNKSLTAITELGEFGLIDTLTKDLTIHHASTIKAVGDDAAVVDFSGNKALISTDMLIEGVHFDLTYTPLKHLGYKAVCVNLSDIAAMNAMPTHITVSLAISSRFPVEAIEELYSGIKLACNKYKIDVIGGDISASKAGLCISITVIGDATEEDIVYRAGAKEHDLVCVSGDLGAAYAGLLVLNREKEVFKATPEVQPDLSGYDYVLERQLKPEAQTECVKILKDAGIKPTSMIDISDGLASELLHLCRNSKCGCRVYEEKIPIDPQTISTLNEFDIVPLTGVLNGGEDYELLFTISQKDFERIKPLNIFTIIGHIVSEPEGAALISGTGQEIMLKSLGWDAFKGK